MDETSEKSTLDQIADVAEQANAIASLVVGHLKILLEGGFDFAVANGMAASLHAHLLGITEIWQVEPEFEVEYLSGEDDE